MTLRVPGSEVELDHLVEYKARIRALRAAELERKEGPHASTDVGEGRVSSVSDNPH